MKFFIKLLSFIFVCLILLVSTSLQAKIKIATYIEPPFSNFIDGEFNGAYLDIIKLMAANSNEELQFLPCPAARCLQMVEDGSADIMMGVRKTHEREEQLYFLEPPIKIQEQPLRFYIREESIININKYSDLAKLSIGILRGASYFDQFDQDKSLSKVPVTNHKQLVDMLLNGRIDTFLEREQSITPIVDQEIYKHKIKLAKFSFNQAVASYIAISKKSSLLEEIPELSEKLINLQQSGEVGRILDFYKISSP